MNVFRSRKKSVGEADAPRPSLDNAPPLPKSSRSLFGRKKASPEPKKEELDLTSVLPTDDNFRTSLLMPGLSQRFSMLREQDDPTSKLGKASDDSVLFPKRMSRMDPFNLGNLDDIVEVQSIAGSFRPPFAQEGRVTSFASDSYGGYESDGGGSMHGSIMSRAKPGQGNKFFGGRQKVYKIPTNGPVSGKSSRPGSAGRVVTRGMGKAVYDDDISTSLWQRIRAEERSKNTLDFDRDDDGRLSPALSGYDRKRETTSSTNSNERVSTAATSMTSMADQNGMYLSGMMSKEQAKDRPLNKRLYGQAIDQQVQEHQSSALQRLNSVRGGKGFQSLAPVRNPSIRQGAVSSASSQHSGSPSPALGPVNGFDFGTDKPASLGPRDLDSGYHGSPNMTPPISPSGDHTLIAHLDPNDHGKATASGAFNKPKARYDDQQFAQRQLQLQEGRDTPTLTQSRSDTPNEQSSGRLRQDSGSSAGTGRRTPGQNFSRPSKDRSQSRDRGESTFQKPSTDRSAKRITGQALNGSYLASFSDSEDEYGSSSSRNGRPSTSLSQEQSNSQPMQAAARSLEEQHPALWAPITEEAENSELHSVGRSHAGSTASSSQYHHQYHGAETGGLSDMVRGHLRSRSDASSVYSDVLPPLKTNLANSPQPEPVEEEPTPASSPITERTRKILETARRIQANSLAQRAAQDSPPRSAPPHRSQPSIEELMGQRNTIAHYRGPSTDTMQERDAFADELADRARQVEQKLKNIADSIARTEADDRAREEGSQGKFGLLKKNSRSSLANENSSSTSVFKKLITGSGSGSSTPTPQVSTGAVSPRRGPSRMNSEPDMHQGAAMRSGGRTAAGDAATRGERSIGADRRARHAEAMRSPRGTGAAPPRGRVDARKAQFTGPSGMAKDFTERVQANPDQGKPNFHPAGRARHYSPPRAKETPDQKPKLPMQQPSTSAMPGTRSKTPSGQGRRQASGDGSSASTPPPGNIKSHTSGENAIQQPRSSGAGAQMITPGTFPAPNPSGSTNQGGYASARKRSVSKADISGPTFLSGTYAMSTVDLGPGASLDNGMAEVRATDAATGASPPPVPPINPRRRAMGAIKGLGRSNTGSPDSEGETSPSRSLRRQKSEGAVRASPVKGY